MAAQTKLSWFFLQRHDMECTHKKYLSKNCKKWRYTTPSIPSRLLFRLLALNYKLITHLIIRISPVVIWSGRLPIGLHSLQTTKAPKLLALQKPTVVRAIAGTSATHTQDKHFWWIQAPLILPDKNISDISLLEFRTASPEY